MEISVLFNRIKTFRAMIILLISLTAQNSFAFESVTITENIIPPIGVIIDLPLVVSSACLIGQPCPTDAVWTGWQLPTLQVGQELSISTSSTTAFFLGNSLNGQLNVSLTPIFKIQSNTNTVDELTANIANRTSIFSTTNDGLSTFDTSSGTDYYLLLAGTLRYGITYELQVSQVPLPAAFCLFGSGLTLLLASRKRKFYISI